MAAIASWVVSGIAESCPANDTCPMAAWPSGEIDLVVAGSSDASTPSTFLISVMVEAIRAAWSVIGVPSVVTKTT